VDEFLKTVTALIAAISAFFDKVLVMADDKKMKENRLGLLQQVAVLSKGIADLSKLEGF
jgi:glycyl-tRNA synthetase beta subunit